MQLSRLTKVILYIFADICCVFLGFFIMLLFVNRDYGSLISSVPYIAWSVLVMSVIYVSALSAVGGYSIILQYASTREYVILALASSAATVLSTLFVTLFPYSFAHREIVFAGFVVTCLLVAYRVTYREVKEFFIRHKKPQRRHQKRLLIIGSGAAANLVIKEALSNPYKKYNVIGMIDDDPAKLHSTIDGVRVLGNRNEIIGICEKEAVDEILVAMPSAENSERTAILNLCNQTGCKTMIMPYLNDLLKNKSPMSHAREVEIEDLLQRDPVVLDNTKVSEFLQNKVVMVTGGGGSIGSELCRQIARFKPKKLVIVDIYENNAYDIQNELTAEYPELDLAAIISSVRDRQRLEIIFDEYRPNVVFHAAAHKHVPLMETAPGEAIKNNVLGTLNSAECADKFGAEKFILISTDKAVNPTNVMGASKRVCEMIIQAINNVSKTEYAAVRFGNVLGSNGSVIPLFKKQIQKGGPITITHKNITRYFMTIPEAAQLVMQAAVFAKGGEIFVLDMGEPVKIYDLALNLIRLSGYVPEKDIEIKVVGLREGEKLYEELLMSEEGLLKTANKKIFIAQPQNINLAELKEKICELEKAAKTADTELIKDTISRFVPTYQRSYSAQNDRADKTVSNGVKQTITA